MEDGEEYNKFSRGFWNLRNSVNAIESVRNQKPGRAGKAGLYFDIR